jgi:UDP-N-acetylglucosamine:LPS N-acetylglucosamine transferase
LRPAFEGYDVAFGTVQSEYSRDVPGCRFYLIPDSNRNTKLNLLRTALVVLTVILRERPAAVISTGAAPGGLALFFARRLGVRTIWIDSIANVDRLSLSGKKVGRYADLWMTQWPDLAQEGGPEYFGAVL